MDTIATLQQLDQECITWAHQHTHSCNLLASLINITRQREQTLTQWQQQQQQQVEHQRSRASKDKTLLATFSLQLLIHKQTLEIESAIRQLYETLEVFKKVLLAMVTLERHVEAAIQRMDTSTLLETISHPNVPLPSTSVPARSTSASSSSELACTRSASLSSPRGTTTQTSVSVAFSPTLMDTADILPLEALDWVSRIRAMYAQELNEKQTQIHPSMTSLDRFDTLVDLQRNWGLQKRIDFGLEQEIVERIKTYRRVREFSSRV